MNTLEIVAIVIVAVLALLALLGFIAQRRRLRATESQFHAQVEQANRDLAAAHAADNGWEPGRVEAAARRAFTDRTPGEEIREIALVQVIDRPGTEDDQAIFEIATAGGRHQVTLNRRGDDWVAV